MPASAPSSSSSAVAAIAVGASVRAYDLKTLYVDQRESAKLSHVTDPPEPSDMHDGIARELQRLFPSERIQRILEGLGLDGTEQEYEYLGDLISAIFTRGIEFGAVEVAAQQIEAGARVEPHIEIAHVDLP